MNNLKETVLTIIETETTDITEKLDQAKIQFANAHLNDDEWTTRNSCEKKCQVYKGQLDILAKISNQIISNLQEVANG